jgi:hypothetical protein
MFNRFRYQPLREARSTSGAIDCLSRGLGRTAVVAAIIALVSRGALAQESGQVKHANCNAVSMVTIAPSNVIGGTPSTGTVTLRKAANAGGLPVQLASDDTSAASVPAQVVVSAGAASATFSILTMPVATDMHVFISAFCGNDRKNGNRYQISVRAPRLIEIETPKALRPGATGSGKVTLLGPAPSAGFAVALEASAALSVPSNVVVPAGQLQAMFALRADANAGRQTVGVVARAGGSILNSTTTIDPNAGPPINPTASAPPIAVAAAPAPTRPQSAPLINPATVATSLAAVASTPALTPKIQASTQPINPATAATSVTSATSMTAVATTPTMTPKAQVDTQPTSSMSSTPATTGSDGPTKTPANSLSDDSKQVAAQICEPERVELRPSGAERCFGAIGQACKSQAEWGIFNVPPINFPVAEVASDCRIQERVSVGSIAHDTCCERNPDGLYCKNDPGDRLQDEISDLPCHREWRKAVYDSIEGRNWTVTFGPYYQGGNGDDLSPASDPIRSLSTLGPLGVQDAPVRYGLEEVRATRALAAPSGKKLEYSDVEFCKSGRFREEGWCDLINSCSTTTQLGGMSFAAWAANKEETECKKYWDLDPRRAACYAHIASEGSKWNNRKSHWGICE